MNGYDHTGKELRELADELWERGFKEISTYVHSLAAKTEGEEKSYLSVTERNYEPMFWPKDEEPCGWDKYE